MLPAPHWSLSELSQEAARMLSQAGLLSAQGDGRVSAAPDARTVRYYTTLGLLDRPALQGRDARYGRKHLLQLVAVKALQTGGQNLADIQQRLYGRTEAELARIAGHLIAQAAQVPPPPPALRQVVQVALAPGLVLLAEPGLLTHDPEQLVQQFRAALAAITQGQSTSRGGTS
jgi:DNA-binding transcriptional MerR regulator